MQIYCADLFNYHRLQTREVNIGGLYIGNGHPIRIQTMTTTDTLDTAATVAQTIRCIEAGAELVRITAPSKKEAENLAAIKAAVRKAGYTTPLVADIHFTPNAAEIAARIVEKVRVNPGNYVDKKRFEQIDYTDIEYQEEIERIRDRFLPLVHICKQHGTAMRIGTNHGSLSDRIMSRFGDTPMGMVESAMEFLRIARTEHYYNIVLSMKSSNPQVMVQAYRLLVQTMQQEFNECYPLHLGVTEAGDAEDGRIKSAAGIGSLLEDGIGDTIRVSLTEDPEFEIPVCADLVKRYQPTPLPPKVELPTDDSLFLGYDPLQYSRRKTQALENIGGKQVPVVIADLSKKELITYSDLSSIGYRYDARLDKWQISDMAADYVFIGSAKLDMALPGTLKIITWPQNWLQAADHSTYFPIFTVEEYLKAGHKSSRLNFVMLDCSHHAMDQYHQQILNELRNQKNLVLCLSSEEKNAMQAVRRMFVALNRHNIDHPVVLLCDSNWSTIDEHLIHYATETGALLLDGMGDGICLGMSSKAYLQASDHNAKGRNYHTNTTVEEFLNHTAFGILQATRTRISKTEYISCPSCGRTLFELQETTARIRQVTSHLKGLKIAIMGCIVNGPGEMADADFGYVGSGPGKITLYKGKEIVKRNVDSEIAVEELVQILKEHGAWIEPN